MDKNIPPLYVSYIFKDYVRLEGDTSKILDLVSKTKYQDRVFHDQYGVNIRFTPSNSISSKSDLLDLLQWLNKHNVLFSMDRGWGPSEIMQEFQERGFIKDTFVEIAWKGPGQWFITKRIPKNK
jgi:hypothetical protein